MNRKNIMFILVFVSISLCNLKIGWIDGQRILDEYEDVKVVLQEVSKEENRLTLQYQDMTVELDSLVSEYQTRKVILTPDKVSEMEALITQKQQELQMFVQNVQSPQGELAAYYNSLMIPVQKRVDTAVQKVAIESSYDYILDCSAGACPFTKEEHNLTGYVLEELKKLALDSLEE